MINNRTDDFSVTIDKLSLIPGYHFFSLERDADGIIDIYSFESRVEFDRHFRLNGYHEMTPNVYASSVIPLTPTYSGGGYYEFEVDGVGYSSKLNDVTIVDNTNFQLMPQNLN